MVFPAGLLASTKKDKKNNNFPSRPRKRVYSSLNQTVCICLYFNKKSIIAPDKLSLGGESVRWKTTSGQANKQTKKRAAGGAAAHSKHHPSTREVKLSPPPQVGIHLPLSGPWEGCPDSPSVCPDLCLGLWVCGWVKGRRGGGDRGGRRQEGLWHTAAVLTTGKLAAAGPNSSPGLPAVLRYRYCIGLRRAWQPFNESSD